MAIPAGGPYLEPAVLEVEWTPTAVVKATGAALDALPGLFGRGYQAVSAALQDEGRPPVGPAFALYRHPPGATVDVELGFPLIRPLQGGLPAMEQDNPRTDLDVVPSELPGGRVAVLSHLGPYDALADAWRRLTAWVEEQGRAPRLPFWEVYVTEPAPETDPATLRTDLYLPLR
ncbi:transcriptional regulator [Zafaria cholistanensis]|uniref:Transcriptional regulator n=1 Tax=Zafaria cholistanensis TaxID=1682741 RepID=A0A5A7NV09_9MICC|nr:GyrI-like domain-containing protein [Zafaria cholistanensis]GER23781.1 transcriptional regulator [Zafaria cholistanensis]